MIQKSIESNISMEQILKQKRKIRLIIVSKGAKSNNVENKDKKEEKEKNNSKVTLQNQKGRFEIRMENFTQTLDKNKIDKTVKSIMKNITLLNLEEKNDEQMNNTVENIKESRNNGLIDNKVNNFCDIYLEKKKKKGNENIIVYKNKKDINEEDDISFKKIKMNESEKETNHMQYDDGNKKESNRDLLIKQNSEDKILCENSNQKKEIKNLLNIKGNSFNINNFFKNNNNKNEHVTSLIKNKDKNLENEISNKKEKNNIHNNLSRNVDKQLISNQNSDLLNQSTKYLNKVQQNISNNSNHNINNNYGNNIDIQIKKGVQKFTCSICDISYTSSLSFVAECNIHILCKKCAKYFFEEKIESGVKELFCPFISCGKKFPKSEAKLFLSKRHINLLEEKNEKNDNFNSVKFLFDDDNDKDIKNYSNNHVIDINNNRLFYNFNKSKNIFCTKCNVDALFCRDKQTFMRCLNCHYKQCKYCFKEYSREHFDRISQNYCKVYYRNDDIFRNQLSNIYIFLKQILFVVACFLLSIITPWILSKHYLTNSLLKKNNHNDYNCILYYIKIIIINFFSFLIFIIFLPITVLLFPYFPSFLAIFDFK